MNNVIKLNYFDLWLNVVSIKPVCVGVHIKPKRTAGRLITDAKRLVLTISGRVVQGHKAAIHVQTVTGIDLLNICTNNGFCRHWICKFIIIFFTNQILYRDFY